MKQPRLGVAVLLASLAWPALAVAANPAMEPIVLAGKAEPGSPEAKMEADEKQMRRDLEQAQERLAEAAREVARLSEKLSGGAMERVARYFAETGRKAMLGVTIGTEAKDGEPGPAGVRVYGVSPGGPAEAAGLETGDIILSVNGEDMAADGGDHADHKLMEFMQTVEPGDAVTVRYWRDGREAQATVVTRAFEPEAFAFSFADDDEDLYKFEGTPELPGFVLRMDDHEHGAGPFAGHHLELVSMTPGLGAYFGTEEGLLVVRSDAGLDFPLQEGDVVLSVDGREATRPGQVLKRLAALRASESLAVQIVRQRQTLTVQIEGPGGGDREDPGQGEQRTEERMQERIEKP